MRRWDGLCDGYRRECEARGLMESTLYTRMRELERFGLWLKRRKPRPRLEDVDGQVIIRYIQSRTAFHSKSTICGIVTELRGMGEYLMAEGIWLKSPMRWIRGPKLSPQHRLPRRIGSAHLEKIWDAALQRPQEYARYQAVCILGILYGTGIRRGELERLDIDDWDRDNGTLTIDGRKTGRQRRVPVGKNVWRCVEAYLPHRQNMLERKNCLEEQAFLVNRFGARLKSQDISLLVHRLAKSAEVPLVSLHQFRHSCASDLIESGVSLPEVQQILGHAMLQSTMQYTHIADPERVEAIARHPINDFIGDNIEEGRRVAS